MGQRTAAAPRLALACQAGGRGRGRERIFAPRRREAVSRVVSCVVCRGCRRVVVEVEVEMVVVVVVIVVVVMVMVEVLGAGCWV
jgi:hypothetical protein